MRKEQITDYEEERKGDIKVRINIFNLVAELQTPDQTKCMLVSDNIFFHTFPLKPLKGKSGRNVLQVR